MKRFMSAMAFGLLVAAPAASAGALCPEMSCDNGSQCSYGLPLCSDLLPPLRSDASSRDLAGRIYRGAEGRAAVSLSFSDDGIVAWHHSLGGAPLGIYRYRLERNNRLVIYQVGEGQQQPAAWYVLSADGLTLTRVSAAAPSSVLGLVVN